LLAIAALGILGTAFAMLLMNSLIRYSSAIFSSSVTYIIPIFAILWGILDHEKITLVNLLCMLLILAGVYLINKKKRFSL
jgi:drug/metabolite transporter (DMT)-like permease